METQLCIVVCVLVSAGLVTGQIYYIPTASLDTPDDSVCPPDSQLEALRTNISNNLSNILVEIAANKTTIPACGGSGWRRVAFLDMTDPDQTCPQPWRMYSQNSVRACGRQESDTANCDSVQFSSDGYKYTQVCGRIIGYQYGHPDGLVGGVDHYLNESYVDGVSVTHGIPHIHIWSLLGEYRSTFCCSASVTVPLFIGDNYFCDTGNPDDVSSGGKLFTDSPLWDGIAGCSGGDCCAPHSGPWFNTTLNAPTTDDIEIRICGNQSGEDTPLELVDIYIK